MEGNNDSVRISDVEDADKKQINKLNPLDIKFKRPSHARTNSINHSVVNGETSKVTTEEPKTQEPSKPQPVKSFVHLGTVDKSKAQDSFRKSESLGSFHLKHDKQRLIQNTNPQTIVSNFQKQRSFSKPLPIILTSDKNEKSPENFQSFSAVVNNQRQRQFPTESISSQNFHSNNFGVNNQKQRQLPTARTVLLVSNPEPIVKKTNFDGKQPINIGHVKSFVNLGISKNEKKKVFPRSISKPKKGKRRLKIRKRVPKGGKIKSEN